MTVAHPARYALRVLDNDTGEEIVRDLPYLSADWKQRALQPGQPGSSLVSTHRIVLPGPGSLDFDRYEEVIRSLQPGMRVEAYFGGRVIIGGVDNAGAGASEVGPAHSGIIQNPIERNLRGPWTLTLSSSAWMLQQTQSTPGELIHAGGSGSPWVLAAPFFGCRELLWGDDFSNWFGVSAVGTPAASDYTNSGWSATGSDPYLAGPAIFQSTANTEFNITTTTTWGTSVPHVGPFEGGTVAAEGVMAEGTPGAGNVAGNIGIWLFADATAQNGLLVDVIVLPQTVGGWYSVTARINTRVAGAFTGLASVSNVMQNVTSPLEYRLEAILCLAQADPAGSSPGTGQYIVKVRFNGKDTGCQAQYLNVGPGRIGLRSFNALGGSPATYVNRFTFDSRTSGNAYGGGQWGTNRFSAGSLSTSGPLVPTAPIVSTGQSNLDVIAMMATAANFYVRVSSGSGHKGDSVDFGGGVTFDNPGADLSDRIRIREGENVLMDGTQVASISDLFGSGVRLAGIPGSDSGGIATFDAVGKPGKTVLQGSVTDMGIPGFSLLSRYARALQARHINPVQAVAVHVVRTLEWVNINYGFGPRECDIVLVDLPTLEIFEQPMVIIGIDISSGGGSQMVYFSAIPYNVPGEPASRLRNPVDWLARTYATR